MSKITKENNIVLIIGILLVFIGLILIGYKIYNYHRLQNNEQELIEQFFSESSDEVVIDTDSKEIKNTIKSTSHYSYLMILEIPKINLEKGIYDKSSKYNSVNYGIQILKESNIPNDENGNVILASHRGNSSVSYFNKLYKVEYGDIVYLYYNNVKYAYEINNKYEVEKNGTVSISRDLTKNTITLITCKKNENKQLVYIGNLVNRENY
jgi:LPXTG-site transpeptidase (sortase) family protein